MKCDGGFATLYLWGFYLCTVMTNYHFNLFCQVPVKQKAGWTPGITIKTAGKLIIQRKIVMNYSFFQTAVLSQAQKSFIRRQQKLVNCNVSSISISLTQFHKKKKIIQAYILNLKMSVLGNESWLCFSNNELLHRHN